jgi:hypothetical protein
MPPTASKSFKVSYGLFVGRWFEFGPGSEQKFPKTSEDVLWGNQGNIQPIHAW